MSCSWQKEAIGALAFLAPAEEWQVDAGGDLCLPEDPDTEAPGWVVSLHGQRMRMEWGCITFESDVEHDEYARSARWLMAAAAAWGVDEREVAQ